MASWSGETEPSRGQQFVEMLKAPYRKFDCVVCKRETVHWESTDPELWSKGYWCCASCDNHRREDSTVIG